MLIQIPVGTLGDTLGWFPYVARFAEAGCRLTCAMAALITAVQGRLSADHFASHEEGVEKRLQDTFYATYCLGLFFDDEGRRPPAVRFPHVGLHRTAGYILGVDPTEVPPRIVLADDSADRRTLCLHRGAELDAEQILEQPAGWREIVAFLKAPVIG